MTEMHNYQCVAPAALATYSDLLTKSRCRKFFPELCFTIVGSVLADRPRHVETEDYSLSLNIYQTHRVTNVSSVANE
jgi:hypothetical protein